VGHVKDRWLTQARKPSARHGTGKRWQVWYQVDGHETLGGSFANREVAKKKLVAPKTARSRRSVPLPDVVSVALAEHLRQYPPTAGGLLFHASTGRPYHHDWINNKTFVPAALKAGLPQGTPSHALRHHYASVFLAAGESVIAVAERLGHDNANLVLSTYGHPLPNLEDRTRKAVDSAWDDSQQAPNEAPTAQGRPR
jgi:integrase